MKFELAEPGVGVAFSPECEARGNGMFSSEGVELTM